MNKKECGHRNLFLLPSESEDRVRCRCCHLTIKVGELGSSYCPECYDIEGKKRYDFEEVEAEQNNEQVQYRCEDCGLLISV